MTQTGTNWKNVNNWHWVEKNCLPWAKEYFIQKLTGTAVEKGDVKVSVNEVRDVTGDVDLNQRKGKIITIFDVVLTLGWKGEGFGTTAEGKIFIPEYMHDTDAEDIVFDVSTDSPNSDRDKIKEVVRIELTKAIRARMVPFAKDLVDGERGLFSGYLASMHSLTAFTAHIKDVYIAPEEMKGHPVLKTYQPKPPAPETNPVTSACKTAAGGVTTIKQTIEFAASPRDIYETLLDVQRVQAWTRGKAQVGREAGSAFVLFDGNISGTTTELVPNTKIVQQWRLKTWPVGHFSTVTFDLGEGSDKTVLKVTQSGVPVSEKEMAKQWERYYWHSIKATFGFDS
ncbi:hypothetical protein HKX48_008124 [Thoreauomyces humboldtii]|nr:hypothetical protein HKX48_008124 [Thoreauomyces humboldtii]